MAVKERMLDFIERMNLTKKEFELASRDVNEPLNESEATTIFFNIIL